MKKMAIFVEGQTERIFCEAYIDGLELSDKIHISSRKMSGGGRHDRYIIAIRGNTPENQKTPFYILITDCGTDSRVASDIKDQIEGLTKAGFNKIVGIRDLAPLSQSQLRKLEIGINKQLAELNISIDMIIPVMEIEMWFLAEHTHFQKIHAALTTDRIKRDVGIDVLNEDLERRISPSDDIDDIYQLERFQYKKSEEDVTKTVEALDWEFFCSHVASKSKSAKQLKFVIYEFLHS